MWTKLRVWWNKQTLNEKLMYVLVMALTIGIITRWRFVLAEIGDAFRHIFMR